MMRVLRAYYRVRLNTDAEIDDLLQAALLKIHFARDRYHAELSLKTWVFTIASRTLIDHWRGKSSDAKVFDPNYTEAGEEHDPIAQMPAFAIGPDLKLELTEDINKALLQLKPIDRSIVYLYGVEGFSMAEIAKTLSLTEGAVKLRAHRAYAELRKLLVLMILMGVFRWMH